MASNPRNVRQRTDDEISRISDLPVGFIADVSSYLPKPSRAILAVAFSAPSSSWQNDNLMHRQSPISTAIVSASQWDILDFEDVEKELANKMTDDDISAVLTSIGAHDVLKKLKLCGCININGHGLSPLRGSSILEQVDISLARKNEAPQIDIPRISHEIVLPILDSIICSDGCTLKYIQLPWKWRETPPVIELRRRYNQHLDNQGFSCSKCNRNMNAQEWMNDWFENTMMCYECLNPICSQCDMDGRAAICRNYKKKYCDDCVYMTECHECERATCENCLNSCNGCSRTGCENCIEMLHCEGCTEKHCEECYNGKEYSIKYCEECGNNYCSSCRFDDIKERYKEREYVVCDSCVAGIADLMLEEMTKLRKENEELKEKVESMSL